MGLDSIPVHFQEVIDFLIALWRDDRLRFELRHEFFVRGYLQLPLALVNPLTETVHGNLLPVKGFHRFNQACNTADNGQVPLAPNQHGVGSWASVHSDDTLEVSKILIPVVGGLGSDEDVILVDFDFASGKFLKIVNHLACAGDGSE